MTRDLRPRVHPISLVAKNDPANYQFFLEPTSAVISKTRIVIAQDPDPVEVRSEIGQQLTRMRREPLATEPIMKTVPEAKETLGVRRFDGMTK